MRLCSAEVGSIDPQNRIVTQLPLRELWDSAGNVPAQRVRDLGRAQIRALLRAGPVRFVVADVGSTLGWISATLAHSFWKSQVQRHLAEPDQTVDLARFPGEYCYFASEWRDSDGKPPIILLEKVH